MGLIEQMLIEGNDSLLYKELAQKRGITDSVEGGINALGNMFNYNGPMLLVRGRALRSLAPKPTMF